MNKLQIGLTGLVLAAFTVVGVGIVAWMHHATKAEIAKQTEAALNRQLAAVLPQGFDNDPATSARELASDALFGGKGEAMLYTARQGTKPIGWALRVIAPNGYSGAIHLLVGVDVQGKIAGVRVIAHKETPGLGDPIEIEKSPWIESFRGKSLLNPDNKGWHVKKDGGTFDQFTGATITPRAVVQAVHNALLYVEQHRDELLEATP
ncbi:MAG: electron transport complex subunit RsxG [Halothiobacillaceae bacterium]